MATKADRNLEAELGPSPWPLFANDDEPWTDLDRLLKLNEKFDYQYEIAHVLGATPSQISYWMGKAEEYAHREALKSGALCVSCEENETPGGSRSGNQLCDDCLDEARATGRGHTAEAQS